MLPDKKYKHIFFDLDMTLWDFETNAHEAYQDIYAKFKLKDRGIESIELFLKSYFVHNEMLWEQYRNDEIEKEFLRSRRFELALLDFGIEDPGLAESIGMEYITISPQKTNLFPNAHEILSYLKLKYPLHIITNGFEEVQYTKLKNSRLSAYFDQIITSEDAGCKKPDPGIFRYALQKAGAKADESLMIGDDPEVDVKGAEDSGMDGVFFNPKGLAVNGNVKYQINDLIELKNWL
jgi:putative hydrolase of the HAD superfamily